MQLAKIGQQAFVSLIYLPVLHCSLVCCNGISLFERLLCCRSLNGNMLPAA